MQEPGEEQQQHQLQETAPGFLQQDAIAVEEHYHDHLPQRIGLEHLHAHQAANCVQIWALQSEMVALDAAILAEYGRQFEAAGLPRDRSEWFGQNQTKVAGVPTFWTTRGHSIADVSDLEVAWMVREIAGHPAYVPPLAPSHLHAFMRMPPGQHLAHLRVLQRSFLAAAPRCHYCGCPGHKIASCRKLGRVQCYVCRVWGHTASHCPTSKKTATTTTNTTDSSTSTPSPCLPSAAEHTHTAQAITTMTPAETTFVVKGILKRPASAPEGATAVSTTISSKETSQPQKRQHKSATYAQIASTAQQQHQS